MDAERQAGDNDRNGGHEKLLQLIHTMAEAQIGMLQHQLAWIDEHLRTTRQTS